MVGGDDVVEPVEGVDEVLDGQADVVRQELEAFEFDDDGEASECCADLGDEDRNDAVSRLVLEVDDQGWGSGRGVGACGDAFYKAGPLDAVDERRLALVTVDAIR